MRRMLAFYVNVSVVAWRWWTTKSISCLFSIRYVSNEGKPFHTYLWQVGSRVTVYTCRVSCASWIDIFANENPILPSTSKQIANTTCLFAAEITAYCEKRKRWNTRYWSRNIFHARLIVRNVHDFSRNSHGVGIVVSTRRSRIVNIAISTKMKWFQKRHWIAKTLSYFKCFHKCVLPAQREDLSRSQRLLFSESCVQTTQ